MPWGHWARATPLPLCGLKRARGVLKIAISTPDREMVRGKLPRSLRDKTRSEKKSIFVNKMLRGVARGYVFFWAFFSRCGPWGSLARGDSLSKKNSIFVTKMLRGVARGYAVFLGLFSHGVDVRGHPREVTPPVVPCCQFFSIGIPGGMVSYTPRQNKIAYNNVRFPSLRYRVTRARV